MRTEYKGDRIKDGVFGAMMSLSLVNDVRPSFCYPSQWMNVYVNGVAMRTSQVPPVLSSRKLRTGLLVSSC